MEISNHRKGKENPLVYLTKKKTPNFYMIKANGQDVLSKMLI